MLSLRRDTQGGGRGKLSLAGLNVGTVPRHRAGHGFSACRGEVAKVRRYRQSVNALRVLLEKRVGGRWEFAGEGRFIDFDSLNMRLDRYARQVRTSRAWAGPFLVSAWIIGHIVSAESVLARSPSRARTTASCTRTRCPFARAPAGGLLREAQKKTSLLAQTCPSAANA